MSGILAGEDEKSRALRLLILLLAVLLCVFFLLSACASHRLLTVSEPADHSLVRYSEERGAAGQDVSEASMALRPAAPALTCAYTLCPDVKRVPRTFFRLFLRLDESSGVIAANIGGHAPPASPVFTSGSMGPSRL